MGSATIDKPGTSTAYSSGSSYVSGSVYNSVTPTDVYVVLSKTSKSHVIGRKTDINHSKQNITLRFPAVIDVTDKKKIKFAFLDMIQQDFTVAIDGHYGFGEARREYAEAYITFLKNTGRIT